MTTIRRGRIWRRAHPMSREFTPEGSPFFHLARLVGLYHLEMDRVLKRIDMDVPRWRVLNILNRPEPAGISEIADLAVIRISTMTKLVYRMQDEGLVEASTSPTDGRVTEVTLTGKGRQAVEQVRTNAAQVFERAFVDVPDVEIGMLMDMLRRLSANLR